MTDNTDIDPVRIGLHDMAEGAGIVETLQGTSTPEGVMIPWAVATVIATQLQRYDELENAVKEGRFEAAAELVAAARDQDEARKSQFLADGTPGRRFYAVPVPPKKTRWLFLNSASGRCAIFADQREALLSLEARGRPLRYPRCLAD